jgi:CheY-like chemotaxis protein
MLDPAAESAAPRAKSRDQVLLTGISEELRTPASLMASLSWAIERRGGLDEPMRHALGLAGRAARSLLDVADDLSAAANEVEEDISRREGVWLHHLVHQALVEFEPSAAELGLKLSGARLDILPEVALNGAAFANLIRRMLLCAFRRASVGSEVRISIALTRQTGRVIETSFEVHVRAPDGTPAGTDTRPVGHTVRLLAVDTLARAFGAWLNIRETVAGNLTLGIRFTAIRMTARPPQLARTDMQLALVVDDHAGQRAIARRLLEANAMAVAEAESAFEALELRKHMDFDLYLLDHRMPGMSGTELAGCLRMSHGFQGAVLLMTSSEDPAVREAALLNGVDVFLPKPLSGTSMRAALEELAALPRLDGSPA